jgi:hypothetical protein
MFPRILEVRHVRDYRLELTFTDGERAELDFKDMIVGRGGVFAELEDVEAFRRVSVDTEAGTLVWPNGVDFCPDVLYSRATGTPLPETELQPPKE